METKIINCDECGNTCVKTNMNFYVCSVCGLEQEQINIDNGTTGFGPKQTQINGMNTSSKYGRTKLGTWCRGDLSKIHSSGGIYKFHQLARLNSDNSFKTVNELDALNISNSMCAELQLSITIREEMMKTFTKILSQLKERQRFRAVRYLIPAIFYKTLLIHNISITMEKIREMRNYTDLEYTRFTNTVYLISNFFDTVPRESLVNSRIHRVCDELELPTILRASAINIYKKQQFLITSRIKVSAGAAICLAILKHRKRAEFKHNSIANNLKIRASTISYQIQKVFKYYGLEATAVTAGRKKCAEVI